jgi:hypothetical protein
MGIDYEGLVQEGLRGVVKRILTDVARDGLEDPNHFYITFRTDYPGVDLPDSVREENPEDVTIVLQHQFWDLEVGDEAFTVMLSFQETPYKVRVPFYTLLSFMDPGLRFGLQFTPPPIENFSDHGVKGPATPLSKKPLPVPVTDGSNVVSLDAFRKK